MLGLLRLWFTKPCIALFVLVIVASLLLPCCTAKPAAPAQPPPTDTTPKTQQKETPAAQTPKDWPEILDEVEPSVVLILNRKYYPLRYREKDVNYCPLRYRKKLAEYYDPRWGPAYSGIPPWWASSGFIVDKRGYIVTSYHAIEQAATLYVFLNDGTEINVTHGKEHIAGLIYKNEKTDIAIIKISPGERVLPKVVLGDSNTLKRGEEVFAVGCPLAYQTHTAAVAFMRQIDSKEEGTLSSTDQAAMDAFYKQLGAMLRGLFASGPSTATKGIISAIRKAEETGVPFLQVDAAINTGGNGGPIVNNRGEVIGIASWGLKKAYPLGGERTQQPVEQMNFATPINEVKPLVDKSLALDSPPLISGVYCDILQWGTYPIVESQGCSPGYQDDPTVYPPGAVIKWKTNIPAMSAISYVWNPFECGDIFERTDTNHNCCAKYCGGKIDPTVVFNYCYEHCLRPKPQHSLPDDKLTINHKIALTDLGLLEGAYEFKIICRGASGAEVVSDNYRFLWSGEIDKPFLSKLDEDPNPCCISCGQFCK
jgi:S1-C subfamily serine protease